MCQREQTFDNFMVLDSNRAAFEHSCCWVHRGGSLCLRGPSGTGKTHLVNAACDAVVADSPELRLGRCTAERYVGLYLQALLRNDLEAFNTSWAAFDVLVIEHLEFLSDKDCTTDQLEKLLRRHHAAGKPSLLTASTNAASSWASACDELLLRLRPLCTEQVALQRPPARDLQRLAWRIGFRTGLNSTAWMRRWWQHCDDAGAIAAEARLRVLQQHAG